MPLGASAYAVSGLNHRWMTYDLNGVSARAVPVVVVRNDLRAREAVRVHKIPERSADLSLLRGGELRRWIRRVAVLGLVLRYKDTVGHPTFSACATRASLTRPTWIEIA